MGASAIAPIVLYPYVSRKPAAYAGCSVRLPPVRRRPRARVLLDNYKEVVEGLESTNESVISHRQNDVLRVLTTFSAILLPLTLIASVFGMNVDFPGFGSAAAFWIVVAAMVAVGASLLGFFRWKRWL